MNDLINSFNTCSISEEYNEKGYISEIFSPSRLFLQLEDIELMKLCEDIDLYFKTNQYSSFLDINICDLRVGMKIATYICGIWNRSTVLSDITRRGNVCIFADDFGTKGYINVKYCKMLPPEFMQIPRKSVKACLYGISTPQNTRLFDISATDAIIQFCYNRLFRFKFVKFHPIEDFYEIIACRDDGEILNNYLINTGHAKPICDNTKFDVFYPSFDLLEKSPFYEPYTHRCVYKKKGVDFSAFEDEFIDPTRPYEDQLFLLLKNEKFDAVKNVFEALRS